VVVTPKLLAKWDCVSGHLIATVCPWQDTTDINNQDSESAFYLSNKVKC